MNKATALTGKQVATPTVIDVSLDELNFARESPKRNDLVVRKDWPREGKPWEELLASVQRHGVIMPLVFKEIDGKKYVIAGNRRLDVLREIHGGEISSRIIRVPCIDVASYNNGDPRELAYAANISLPPHPVDRYEVFSMLIDDGMSRDDLAARYVLTARQVDQVLALAKLAPEIRDAWRGDLIDAETAQAFTLALNHNDQSAAFKALKKADALAAHHVRDRFIGKQRDVGRLLMFVGIEKYEADGDGIVHRDLFGSDHTVSDQKQLHRMVGERMDAEISRLTEIDGWAWCSLEHETKDRYTMRELPKSEPSGAEQAEIKKLEKRADETEDQDEADKAIAAIARIQTAAELAGYKPSDRAKAGCVLGIGDQGQLVVRYGLIKPSAEAKADTRKETGEKPKPKKADGSVLSDALSKRLNLQLQRAIYGALNEHPHPSDLCKTLAHVVAAMIDWHDGGTPLLIVGNFKAIQDAIKPAVMQKHLLKCFDERDYFNSVSHAVAVAAIKEMDPKVKPPVETAKTAQIAIKLAGKTDWLPFALRTSHYSGPGAKKGK